MTLLGFTSGLLPHQPVGVFASIDAYVPMPAVRSVNALILPACLEASAPCAYSHEAFCAYVLFISIWSAKLSLIASICVAALYLIACFPSIMSIIEL